MSARAGRDPTDRLAGREVILEVAQHGAVVTAAAIDAATGVEACAHGPAQAQARDLERLALGKLVRRLEALGVLDSDEGRRPPPKDDGPGLLV